MPIIVFQHHDVEGPGRLGATLRDHGHKLDVRRPDRDGSDAVPTDLDDIRGVIIMGGPQNVDGSEPWLATQRQFIKHAHEAEIPVLGICLGAQQIAMALGGQVARMPEPEWGFAAVRTNPGPPHTETMLAGVPWDLPMLHSHGYEVTQAPAGAQVLQSSDKCKIQSFRVGIRTFGFQYHFELDRPMIDAFCEQFASDIEASGTNTEQIKQDADAHYDRMALVGDRLSVNFVSFAFPFTALTGV